MADNSSMLYSLLLQPVPKKPTPPTDPARVLGDYFQFPEKNGTENGHSEDSEAIICKPEFYNPHRKKKKLQKLKAASRKNHMRRIRAMRGKSRIKPSKRDKARKKKNIEIGEKREKLRRESKKEKKDVGEEEKNTDNVKAAPHEDSEAELIDDSDQDPDYLDEDLDDEFDEEDLKPLKKLKSEEKPKKAAVPLLKTDKLTRKEQIQLSKTLIAQKFIQNAFQFFTKNRELKYQDFTPSQLTTACLGLHRNTVQKYRTGPLRPPKPPKQRPKPITNITDDTLQTIKVALDEVVAMKGQATLDSLFKFLKDKDRFKGGRSSLFSILKKSGLFKKLHGKTPGNRAGKSGCKKKEKELNPDGTPKPPPEKVKGPPKKRAKQAATQLQLQMQQQQQQQQQQHQQQPQLQPQHHPPHQPPQINHVIQPQLHQAPQIQQLQIPQQPQQQVQQQPQPQAAHQQPQYQMSQISYADFQNLQALCQNQPTNIPYIPNSQTFTQNQTQSCQNPLQYPQSFYRL